jgi:hypothetical protein
MIHTAAIAPAKEPFCPEAKKNERQRMSLRSERAIFGDFSLVIA